jgi:hypothetical protein
MDCQHEHVRFDFFAQLAGVSRSVPGDCFCQDCKEPIPAWWNNGKPEPIDAPPIKE